MNASKRTQGSALMTALIFGIALSTILGFTLNWGLTEKRVNDRHILRHEAKNAAEAMVEYGFADLVFRFNTQTSFPINELQEGRNPLQLPDSFTKVFGSADSNVLHSKAELVGGAIPPGEWIYISPTDANINDPLKGRRAFVRQINVYSKATAKSPNNGAEITACATEQLQVRDAPLFANAIFYNMDLEFHPGPVMDVHGPVHVNTDAYVQAVSKLTFHEGLFSAGDMFHGDKKSGNHTQGGDVLVLNPAGQGKNMKDSRFSENGGWLDSRVADWKKYAKEKWQGNLLDKSFDMPTLNPMGIDDYVPDDPFTPENERLNHAYAIIEPPLPFDHPDRKPNATREEKMALKANLIFRVERDSGEAHNPDNYNFKQQDVDGDGDLDNYKLFWPGKEMKIKAYKYARTNKEDVGSDIQFDTNGDPVLLPVALPSGLIGGAVPDDSSKSFKIVSEYDGKPSPYAEEKIDGKWRVDKGMFDHRQDVKLNMVSLDVNRLSQLVDNTRADYDPNDWPDGDGDGKPDFVPNYDWNGAVYIEIPTTDATTLSQGKGVNADGSFEHSTSGGRPDQIVSAKADFLGVQLINGGSSSGSTLPKPSYTPEKGLTVATNAPAYIIGNYNSDGKAHSDDANKLDDNSEPPAAIISDTLSMLSSKWYQNVKYSNESGTGNRKTLYTEVSAAVLTGLRPSFENGAAYAEYSSGLSGGAHNFPRFLEKWGNELTIRGSLVALFESEVHDAPMPNNYGHYYSPPKRDWGFNDSFRQGTYPPQTPNTRTFRRIAFRDMSLVEYEKAIDELWK